MQQQPGLFIVLEGADGSGKTTQFHLLHERLKAAGYDVAVFKFPQYDKSSSYFVQQYLNGKYGPASQISPYTASLFYALDRYEAAPAIRKALNSGKIVLADRYVGSNMAHQGSKFTNPVDQRGFFVWDDNLEFYLLDIPRPTLNIFLRVPAEVSRQLIDKENRSDRKYTDKSHDEHERDIKHLQKTVTTYDVLCRLFPKDFLAIECSVDGQLMNIPQISDRIWRVIRPLLPLPPHPGRSVVIQLDKPISTTKLPGLDSKLIDSPATGTKPDNQQFVEIKTEPLSLLAIDAIQSELQIDLDYELLWQNGSKYQYYLPPELTGEMRQAYKRSMDKLISLHRQIQKELKLHFKPSAQDRKLVLADNGIDRLLKLVVPRAAIGSITFKGSTEAINQLQSRLSVKKSKEFQSLHRQLTKKMSTNSSDLGPKSSAGSAKEPQSLSEILEKIVGNSGSWASQPPSTSSEVVHLLEVWPRNELDLLIDSLHSITSSSRDKVEAQLDNWTYQQKAEALVSAMAQPSQILAQARYHLDVVADELTLKPLAQTGVVENLEVQAATPRYGYEALELPQAAKLEELVGKCFEVSSKLYSRLQTAGHESLSEYATLLGHKIRWQFEVNGETLKRQLEKPGNLAPQVRNLMEVMVEKIIERHFLVGTSLKQANEGAVSRSDLPVGKKSARKASTSGRNRKSRTK